MAEQDDGDILSLLRKHYGSEPMPPDYGGYVDSMRGPSEHWNGMIPKPGAWRHYFGPEGEDFIRKALTHAPMALPAGRSPAGAGQMRDIGMSRALENKALNAAGPYDWGITGGEPNPVKTYIARGEGRNPLAMWERSSNDLGTRPGTLNAVQSVKYPRYEYQYPEQGAPEYPANDLNLRDSRPTPAAPERAYDPAFTKHLHELDGREPPKVDMPSVLEPGWAKHMVEMLLRDYQPPTQPASPSITGGTDPNSVYTVPNSAEALLRNYWDAIQEGLPGEYSGHDNIPFMRLPPTRLGKRGANSNEPPKKD